MTTLHHLRVWGDLACFTRPEMKVMAEEIRSFIKENESRLKAKDE